MDPTKNHVFCQGLQASEEIPVPATPLAQPGETPAEPQLDCDQTPNPQKL